MEELAISDWLGNYREPTEISRVGAGSLFTPLPIDSHNEALPVSASDLWLEAPLVHELLSVREQAHPPPLRPFESLPRFSQHERREALRRHYPFCQRIAPVCEEATGRVLPFAVGRFCEISSEGTAFLASQRICSGHLLIELGTAASTSYVIARIIHQHSSNTAGPRSWLVGCRFLDRTYGHWPSPALIRSVVAGLSDSR